MSLIPVLGLNARSSHRVKAPRRERKFNFAQPELEPGPETSSIPSSRTSHIQRKPKLRSRYHVISGGRNRIQNRDRLRNTYIHAWAGIRPITYVKIMLFRPPDMSSQHHTSWTIAVVVGYEAGIKGTNSGISMCHQLLYPRTFSSSTFFPPFSDLFTQTD
jgi:hypothetical protein